MRQHSGPPAPAQLDRHISTQVAFPVAHVPGAMQSRRAVRLCADLEAMAIVCRSGGRPRIYAGEERFGAPLVLPIMMRFSAGSREILDLSRAFVARGPFAARAEKVKNSRPKPSINPCGRPGSVSLRSCRASLRTYYCSRCTLGESSVLACRRSSFRRARWLRASHS
jgi:hypothetical protein